MADHQHRVDTSRHRRPVPLHKLQEEMAALLAEIPRDELSRSETEAVIAIATMIRERLDEEERDRAMCAPVLQLHRGGDLGTACEGN